MKKKEMINRLLLAVFILGVTTLTLIGLGDVPFHPDESTQIYMSSDVEAFFHDPAALFWQPDRRSDLRQHYREMDAPLTRDLIGLARLATGLPAQAVDWDWSLTWQQNQAAGALPDVRALWISRLAVFWLFPASLLLVYRIGKEIGGPGAGWAAMLFFAANPLALLHTRRAMAESALVATSLLSIWGMIRWRRFSWLAALPLALAFNAKQSAGALLLCELVSLLWQSNRNWKKFLVDGLLFAALFAAVTWALNPFLWENPFAAAQSAWQARANFTTTMLNAITNTGARLPDSFSDRLINELYQVFFAAPSIAETANYTRATLAAETVYFANPLHRLLRGLAGGGLMLGLSLTGLLLACRKLLSTDAPERRSTALLLVATLAQVFVLGWIIPIPWQRYYIVLTPLTCLWSGFAIADFWRKVTGLVKWKRKVPVKNI